MTHCEEFKILNASAAEPGARVQKLKESQQASQQSVELVLTNKELRDDPPTKEP